MTDSGHLRKISPAGIVENVARDVVSDRTGGLPGDFGLFNHSVGIAISSTNEVYLVDAYNLRIVRWSSTDNSVVVQDASNWLSRATDGGLAWHPRGVAVAGSEVYVLESMTLPVFLADLFGSPRIRRISPEGTHVIKSVASWPLRVITVSVPMAVAVSLLLWRRRRLLKHGNRSERQA